MEAAYRVEWVYRTRQSQRTRVRSGTEPTDSIQKVIDANRDQIKWCETKRRVRSVQARVLKEEERRCLRVMDCNHRSD